MVTINSRTWEQVCVGLNGMPQCSANVSSYLRWATNMMYVCTLKLCDSEIMAHRHRQEITMAVTVYLLGRTGPHLHHQSPTHQICPAELLSTRAARAGICQGLPAIGKTFAQ